MITEIKSYPLWAYSFTILQLYLATPHQYRLFATIPPLMPTITSYNLTLKRFQLINSTVDQSPQSNVKCVVDCWFKQPHLSWTVRIRIWGRLRLHTCGAFGNQCKQDKPAITTHHTACSDTSG